MESFIEIKNVCKVFDKKDVALDDVSISIKEGEVLGLVGESGSGKTTLGRCVLKLTSIDSGQILYKGEDISKYTKKQEFKFRKDIQIVYQNPLASLNPHKKIQWTLNETLTVHGIKNKKIKEEKIKEYLPYVGLDEEILNKYPKEISGGEAQRILILSVLLLEPKIIIADEPTASLDVSVQAKILNLLKKLQKEFKLTFVYITHDLSVAKYMCENIAVMSQGKIVEYGSTDEIFNFPKNQYTKNLIKYAYFN